MYYEINKARNIYKALIVEITTLKCYNENRSVKCQFGLLIANIKHSIVHFLLYGV